MIPLPLLAPLAFLTAQVATNPTVVESRWTLHEQLQLPAVAANHAVGGVGFGTELQKGIFAFDAEAQMFFVTICDDYSCGPAYEGAFGVSATPGHWHGVTSHLSLLAEYFVHPTFHQSVPALSTRAGFRWFSGGTGVSLDAGLTLAAADNFELDGFARNKFLAWAMPEMVMGFWF